jgi:AcrR family transcriptional regulator
MEAVRYRMENGLSTRETRIAMPRTAASGRLTLDRSAWIRAATETLAEHGVDGVRVELLAKKLEVTKGSFYWHFRDRAELLHALLAQWRDGRIADIVKQTGAEPGAERQRIFHVIEVYSAARNRKGVRIELALRDWARRDAQAAAVVKEVDATRLDRARSLFLACGVPDREATSRSLLLYAYVFGQSLMNYEGPDLAELKRWIAETIAG